MCAPEILVSSWLRESGDPESGRLENRSSWIVSHAGSSSTSLSAFREGIVSDELLSAVAGTGVVGSLGSTMRRKGRTPVSTSDVLMELGRIYHPQLRRILALEQRHQADAADDPEDGPVTADNDLESLGLLREAQWNAISDRLRLQRSGLTAFDRGFTRTVAAAVRQSIAEAARHQVSHAGGLHLAVGILSTQPNNATTALARSHVDAGAAIEQIRASPGYRTPSRPWRPTVDLMRLLGVAQPAGVPPARTAARAVAWLTMRGRTGPTLHALSTEATRQAVLLDHQEVTTGHLVLAMLAMDQDLADAHRHMPTGGANDGARVLRRHGVRREDWRARLAAADPGALRRAGPASPRYYLERPWGPSWTCEAVHGIDSAVRRAGNHRRVGTTAALAGSLSEPSSVAVSVLSGLGVAPDAVARELETLTRQDHRS